MKNHRRENAKHFVGYVVVRAWVCLLQAVPTKVAMWIADQFAWLAFEYIPSRRRISLENITASFPELRDNPAAAEEVVRGMYRHFLRAMVETLLLPRKFHVHNWRAFLDFYPGQAVLTALQRNRAAMIVTAHYGNWELAGYLLGAMGYQTYAIARVLDNPYLERFVLRFRQSTGQTIIAKKDDFDRLTNVLQNGGKVATLADQDAGQRGLFVPFFGRPASTHKAVALMAIEFDALLLVLGMPRVSRVGRHGLPGPVGLDETYYAVEVEDVIDPRDYADRQDAVKAITERYTAGLERIIRRHPEQYLWLHRRWKHQPKAREKSKPAASSAA
ncbi:MAG: lipid A biosynthesis acyltransferase [Planctomycetaceae bacterium]|nr:lipid A biosynthesis acyltransferase [Planctomycetaceae bacterium]